MDLKPRSVRQFLNISPEIVHKDDRMTRGQGILASAEARGSRSLGELFCENTGGRHPVLVSRPEQRKRLVAPSKPVISLESESERCCLG
jgi:hypothetical protein